MCIRKEKFVFSVKNVSVLMWPYAQHIPLQGQTPYWLWKIYVCDDYSPTANNLDDNQQSW